MHMMMQFVRDSFLWDYTGEQETVQQDDEEDYNLFLNIIFVKKLYTLPKKLSKNPLINFMDLF